MLQGFWHKISTFHYYIISSYGDDDDADKLILEPVYIEIMCGFLTQQLSKFAKKTCRISYVDRFLCQHYYMICDGGEYLILIPKMLIDKLTA